MHLLTTATILTALCGMATDGRHVDGLELFHCGFEQASDRDYDGWPDGWTRQRGPGFPHYVQIHESEESSPEGKQCLRINLDGGAAAAFSPPIAIDPRYDYVLKAFLKVEGLRHDDAYFSVRFLDGKQATLESIESPRYRRTDDWTAVRLGPLRCTNSAAEYAVIGVHVQPGDSIDLTGRALFDDVWFAQIPRMTLETADRRFVYVAGERISLECRISGCRESDPHVKLEVDDALGRRLLETDLPLQPAADSATGADARGRVPVRVESFWQPPLREPGYYRIRATLDGGEGMLQIRELPLAVISASDRPEQGPFGWTLADGEGPLPLPALVQLAAQSGIHWLKFPLWYDERDERRVDQLTWLADRLNSQAITLIGLLFNPPEEVRRNLGLNDVHSAANLFAQPPELWYPTLEPVMARMSLKVHHWQLGRDEDMSFAGLRDPVDVLARVKRQLDRIGQDAHLGVGWNWIDEMPAARKPPWRFLSRTAHPALTDEELGAYLAPGVASAGAATAQWASLPALSAERYGVATRAADLVKRMVAAHEHGADRIFFASPLGDEGLVRHDGTPTELFLPWRNTALALAGARCEGSLELPGGSENRVFVQGDKAVVFLWNEAPGLETVFLGDQLRQNDAWGRPLETQASHAARLVEVGPLPTILSEIETALVRWQMSVQLDKEQLPSIFGAPHSLSLSLKNHFNQSANGRVRIVSPAGWHFEPDRFDLRLPAQAEARRQLQVTFPPTASCGRRTVRFEFELTVDRPYRFSVERPLELGMGDVFIKIYSRLNEAGQLEVEQRLVNRTQGDVSFRCHLSAPNRRRMRTQMLRFPPGEDVQTYRLPDGAELIGQNLMIRAEEIGGEKRILNYVFTAEP